MYDNSLIPVALANKLVSLSEHPSQQILKAFARSSVQRTMQGEWEGIEQKN